MYINQLIQQGKNCRLSVPVCVWIHVTSNSQFQKLEGLNFAYRLLLFMPKKLPTTFKILSGGWDMRVFLFLCSVVCRDGPWPGLTRAYFWPAVNKTPTCLRPGYFPTWPEDILFDPKGKKLKNLTFWGEIFQIQTQTINGWPDPSHKMTRPGKNFLPRTHHK